MRIRNSKERPQSQTANSLSLLASTVARQWRRWRWRHVLLPHITFLARTFLCVLVRALLPGALGDLNPGAVLCGDGIVKLNIEPILSSKIAIGIWVGEWASVCQKNWLLGRTPSLSADHFSPVSKKAVSCFIVWKIQSVAQEVAIGRCLNTLCRFVVFVGGCKCPAAGLHFARSAKRKVFGTFRSPRSIHMIDSLTKLLCTGNRMVWIGVFINDLA